MSIINNYYYYYSPPPLSSPLPPSLPSPPPSPLQLLLPIMKAQAESCNAPMQVVGTFLHKLFTDYDMKRYALQPRQPYRQTARLVAAQSPAILHSCHGLSRGQLMSLIINCYNGVPESFQLFRCHSTTSEDELNLFLKRVSIHPFQYMIVGVEKLPYQLQEVQEVGVVCHLLTLCFLL